MADDLVERVARAIEDNIRAALPSVYVHGMDYEYAARAAIEALREPSEEMWDGWRSVNCRKGEFGFEEFTNFSGDYGMWKACHQAMIDALLGVSKLENFQNER